MVEMFWATQFVDEFEIVLPLLNKAVKEKVFVDGPFDATLGARSIIARNVDEDGVIRVGQLLHCVDDATHLVVAFSTIGSENFHHASIEPFLVGIERIPCRQSRRPLSE